MDSILLTILTSTVISALVTVLAEYLNSRRANMLKYITEERKNWRDGMRKIAEDVETSNCGDIGMSITRLKVRINAYGCSAYGNFHKDGHIWEVIGRIEQKKMSGAAFETEKRQLIEYISLLLKYDWERSKREVKGTAEKFIRILLVVFPCAIFMYFYFMEWGCTDVREFVIDAVYLALAGIFMTVVFIQMNREICLPASPVSGNSKKRLFMALLLYALAGGWISIFVLPKWAGYPVPDKTLILVGYFISLLLNLWELVHDLQQRNQYDNAVLAIKVRYKEENDDNPGDREGK